MNESIRRAVKQRMDEKGLSQGDVARALQMQRPNLTKMLSGRSGEIPRNWQELLDFLDLELTVKPKLEPNPPKE